MSRARHRYTGNEVATPSMCVLVLCAEMCARKNSTYRRNFTFFPLLCSVSESSIFEKKHEAEMRCRLPIVSCLIKGAPVSAQHHICYCLLHSSRLRSGVRLWLVRASLWWRRDLTVGKTFQLNTLLGKLVHKVRNFSLFKGLESQEFFSPWKPFYSLGNQEASQLWDLLFIFTSYQCCRAHSPPKTFFFHFQASLAVWACLVIPRLMQNETHASEFGETCIGPLVFDAAFFIVSPCCSFCLPFRC